MTCELTIILENRPGTFAAMGEALGNAGINIEGICGFTCEDKNIVHLLVKNNNAARFALENAGLTVQGERDVLALSIDDRPGEFGRHCRKLAAAGINTNLVYLTAKNHLVIGVDDYRRACTILKVVHEE